MSYVSTSSAAIDNQRLQYFLNVQQGIGIFIYEFIFDCILIGFICDESLQCVFLILYVKIVAIYGFRVNYFEIIISRCDYWRHCSMAGYFGVEGVSTSTSGFSLNEFLTGRLYEIFSSWLQVLVLPGLLQPFFIYSLFSLFLVVPLLLNQIKLLSFWLLCR